MLPLLDHFFRYRFLHFKLTLSWIKFTLLQMKLTWRATPERSNIVFLVFRDFCHFFGITRSVMRASDQCEDRVSVQEIFWPFSGTLVLYASTNLSRHCKTVLRLRKQEEVITKL